MIFVCIPIFNRLPYTIKCIDSILLQSDCPPYKIIICDDGSTDGTSDYLKKHYPQVVVLQGDGNLWWTGGINMCVRYALSLADKDDYIFTLNNDTELFDDTLQQLVEFSKVKPNSIIAGVNLFFNDTNKIEVTAFREKGTFLFPKNINLLYPWGTDIHSFKHTYEEVHALSGKGVLIPVEVFHSMGLYNSDKLPHYHADTEFTRRAERGGYKNYIFYKARIKTHQELTGATQANLNFKNFLNSFFTIRSTNHLQSMYNFSHLMYGKTAIPYFLYTGLAICWDFIRRYTESITSHHPKSLVPKKKIHSIKS